MNTNEFIVCDIDGTIADLSHRLHFIRPETEPVGLDRYKKSGKNWPAFFDAVKDDTPHEDVRRILWLLTASDSINVVYVSGRPERTRDYTRFWLADHNFPWGEIYMRADGDFRSDDIVKEEILDTQLKLTPEDVLCVLDDRDRVVAMWRRRGFRVLQVANGDF